MSTAHRCATAVDVKETPSRSCAFGSLPRGAVDLATVGSPIAYARRLSHEPKAFPPPLPRGEAAGPPDAFFESLIGRLRDECLNETLFSSLSQARAILSSWQDYNAVRPHSALANRTPREFRSQQITLAASVGNGQNFNPVLYL